ncbi:hypothetical protein CF327_g1108 [Tilletia walkeri]|nr:hypothetical protein CF327_g1108 [Tilletia walkeri]
MGRGGSRRGGRGGGGGGGEGGGGGRGGRGRGRGRGGGGGRGRGRGGGRGGGPRDRNSEAAAAAGGSGEYGDSWKNRPDEYFNAAFESYYLEQRLIDSPQEWKELMNAFRQPLPTTFRITSGVPSARLLEDAMKDHWVPFLSNVELPRLAPATAGLIRNGENRNHQNDDDNVDDEVALQAEGVDDDAKDLPIKAEDTVSAPQAEVEEEPSAEPIEDDEEPTLVPPPTQLPFYRPVGLGWQLDVKKNVIRKHPAFKAFQQWLVHETDSGCISRQEAVSMVPPLFLDVRSDHIVLDLCAAPGSKTAQLVEMLHTRGPSTTEALPRGTYDANPEGLVLANDSDTRRAHMLVHQASRIPSANLMVSNLDASMLPRIDVPWLPPTSDPKSIRPITRELKYDRILADVPCSGDGTLRKNIPIWKDWHSQNALGLHALQVRILLRGLALLREGGRLVYSTCSLNPIENEAVVAAALIEFGALKKNGGDVHLVDVSHEIPELIRRPGKRTWKVSPGRGKHLFAQAPPASTEQPEDGANAEEAETQLPPDYVEYDHFVQTICAGQNPQDVKSDATREEDGIKLTCKRGDMKEEALKSTWLPNFPYVESWADLQKRDATLAGRTPKTLWPPKSDEVADKLQLEKCMRFYPHLQNTGGFFVTVLEKRAPKDGYLHGEEGLAAGMRRAMERADLLADVKKEPTEAYSKVESLQIEASAGTSAARAKRELSPENEESEAKRVKTEASVGESSEGALVKQEDEASADPDAHLKSDKYAADRAVKSSKQAVGASDFGHGQPNGIPYREDPMTFLSLEDAEVKACVDFFKLNVDDASAEANNTLRFVPRNLLSRNSEGKMVRSVNLVSYSARAIIAGGGRPGLVPKKDEDGNLEMDGDGDPVMVPSLHPSLNPVRLRLLSAGIKLFQRQDSTKAVQVDMNTPACKWRVTSDGLLVLLPYLNADKIVKISMNELAFLMSTNYPSLYDIEEHAPALAPKVRKMALGSHVVQVGGPDAVDEPELGDAPPTALSIKFDTSEEASTGEAKQQEEGGEPSSTESKEKSVAQRKGEALYNTRQEWVGRKLPVEIALPIWKAAASANLMIDKQVKSALSFRLFGRDLSTASGERHFNPAPPPKKKKDKKSGRPTRAEVAKDQEMADAEDEAMAAAAAAAGDS